MLKTKQFDNGNGYAFLLDDVEVGFGEYEDGMFNLVYGDDVLTFRNGMQAYAHIRQVTEKTKYDEFYKNVTRISTEHLCSA
jgi:hypothetical protein